ncbi:NitT/TauT family transport system ATP-binding protein [Geomicrobium halophilum]|uniref:NitT/TauT family transport system ATP-binding protein n=1 Tax=Geomicrobium halophilum TaxID=549000 RepID=A0A841PH32_9BACL|nr:ABC transporter ATP-binding protein [Geomicrobium halophilum]MBB6448059.1 NitT/TauT family transport system ATP-binding protein [Geomicrobium halophilum]
MALLTLRDVKKHFFSQNDVVEAIRNVNFTVDTGEFVSIIGPSGCGKTTILSLAAGLIEHSEGEILLQDTPITKTNTNIGYMLQQDYLFPWLTIGQNIDMALNIIKRKNKKNQAYTRELLAQMNLSDREHDMPSELSGGMKQRVALVRTLAAKPSLLLLDEPFSALDFQTKLKLEDLIHRTLKEKEKTALLVTHDISEAIAMSDRILLLTHRPAEIKKHFKIPEELRERSPLDARQHPTFQDWFQLIWKELENLEPETT